MRTWTHVPLDMLPGCIAALNDEIRAVRQRKPIPWGISDGQRIAQQDAGILYSFTSEAELVVPDDSPAKLYIKGKVFKATVIGISGFNVLLLVEKADPIGKSVAYAKLETDAAFLLDALRTRLSALSQGQPTTLGLASNLLVSQGQPPHSDVLRVLQENDYTSRSMNEAQIRAIAHVMSNEVAFVWGPPGTGKTKTLAHAVAVLLRCHSTVLIAAHSNAAVDAAALALAKIVHEWEPFTVGRILRVGISREPEMQHYREMQPREAAGRAYPGVLTDIKRLEKERDQLIQLLASQPPTNSKLPEPRAHGDARNGAEPHPNPATRLEDVRRELKALGEQLKQAERDVIGAAQVVLATLSKTAIAEEIYSRRYDAVIVDEASMAYIPANVHLASLATKHFAAFGDFRQLPPIVHGDTPAIKHWLEPDIFQRAGIEAAVEARRNDPRLAMLKKQYRMHPDIAEIVNEFYDKQLDTDDSVVEHCRELLPLPPRDGQSVTLLDTKAVHPFAFKETQLEGQRRNNSRFNPISALVAVELAQALLHDGPSNITIGIITPYVAQARLINKFITDIHMPRDQVKCATVHRFQGSESDVIIYDIVEGKPFTKVGWLVASPHEEHLEARLLNVALSRAKGKLILVADLAHLNKGNILPERNIYRTVLKKLQARSGRLPVIPVKTTHAGFWRADPVPGVRHYPHIPVSDGLAAERLAADLRSAKVVAIAQPPASPMNTSAYSALTPSLVAANLTSEAEVFVSDAENENTTLPITHNQFTWKGPKLPWLVVGIDERVLWIENTEYALRLELPGVVRLLYALWHLLPESRSSSQVASVVETASSHQPRDQSTNTFGRHCPRCGSPLFPRSVSGGFVSVVCQNNACDYRTHMTSQVATEMAQIFKLNCPECNGILVGTPGKYGVYLRCIRYPTCTGHRTVKELV